MSDSVIQATFHNFGKPNLTRKTFSFMMEVPIEQTQKVVEFFGSPDIDGSEWFTVFKLQKPEEPTAEPTNQA